MCIVADRENVSNNSLFANHCWADSVGKARVPFGPREHPKVTFLGWGASGVKYSGQKLYARVHALVSVGLSACWSLFTALEHLWLKIPPLSSPCRVET